MTDVKVVAPMNMGKGLVWNETTKQYDVSAKDSNGVKVNPDGSVGLALSPDAGNQIELRSNGIYLGNIVKPEFSAFYVSSVSGNDDNDGSKHAPFRTLNRAFTAIANNKSNGGYTVFLKAGEYFEFPRKRVWFPQTNMALAFCYYGDPKYADQDQLFGIYNPYGATDLTRPTLEFTHYWDQNANSIVYSGFNTSGLFEMKFYGLHIRFDTLQPGGIAGLAHYHERFIFEGCRITLNKANLGIGSAAEVRIRSCIWENAVPNLFNLFISDKTPKIWDFDLLPQQGDGLGRLPNFTILKGNTRQVLKYNNLCGLSEWDVGTKTLFGFSTNWDCFR